MHSSVSLKDKNWFLRVCHHISYTVYAAVVTLRISFPLVLILSPLLHWHVKLEVILWSGYGAAGWEPVKAHTVVCSRDEL